MYQVYLLNSRGQTISSYYITSPDREKIFKYFIDRKDQFNTFSDLMVEEISYLDVSEEIIHIT